MSDKPYYRFELGINRDPSGPSLEVKDLTGQGRPYNAPLPRAELPLVLVIGRARGAGHDVTVNPLPDPGGPGPCDPGASTDDQVLTVHGFVTERELSTYDDARYVLRITNTSRHYAAEEIQVEVDVGAPGDPRAALPDDNLLLSLVPPEQLIRRIEPGGQHDLAHLVVARGPRPGRYPVLVRLAYRLVLGAHPLSRAHVRLDLPVGVHDPAASPPSSDDLCCEQKPPKATDHSTRSTDMPIHQYGPKGPHQHLGGPIYHAPAATSGSASSSGQSSGSSSHPPLDPHSPHQIPLPGRGFLVVSYRLYKGRRSDWDDDPCGTPVRPRDFEIHFSSQDTAALGLSLRNDSAHFLRHVHVTNIRLYYTAAQGSSAGHPVEATLPDGSPLFEIVPDDVYYGHLGPQERRIKYLGLVTRGVQPGVYLVHMDIRYELEHCGAEIDLGLKVHAD